MARQHLDRASGRRLEPRDELRPVRRFPDRARGGDAHPRGVLGLRPPDELHDGVERARHGDRQEATPRPLPFAEPGHALGLVHRVPVLARRVRDEQADHVGAEIDGGEAHQGTPARPRSGGTAEAERVLENTQHALETKGLDQRQVHPALGEQRGIEQMAPSRDEHHRRTRPQALHRARDLETGALRQREIGEHDVEVAALEAREAGEPVRDGLDVMSGAPERVHEHLADPLLVLEHEDPGGARARRRRRRLAGPRLRPGASAAGRGDPAAGSHTRSRVPRPGSLSTSMRPRWRTTMPCTTESPSPVRSGERVEKKGSKMRVRTSSAMPSPVSATASSTPPSHGRDARLSWPPRGMASIALSTRLVTASRSSAALPRTAGGVLEVQAHLDPDAAGLRLVLPERRA